MLPRPRLLILPLAIGLVLAGCVGSEDAPEPVEEASTDPQPDADASTEQAVNGTGSATGGEAEAPAEESGANATDASGSPPTASSAPEAPPLPRKVELRASSNTTLHAGTPCPSEPVPCQPAQHEAGSAVFAAEEAPAAVALVVNWTAVTPAAETLWVNVTDQDGRLLLSLHGATPLSGEVAPELLAGLTKITVTPQPETPGVVARQEVFHAVTFTYR